MQTGPDERGRDIDEDKDSDENDDQLTRVCGDLTSCVYIRTHRAQHVLTMCTEVVPTTNGAQFI